MQSKLFSVLKNRFLHTELFGLQTSPVLESTASHNSGVMCYILCAEHAITLLIHNHSITTIRVALFLLNFKLVCYLVFFLSVNLLDIYHLVFHCFVSVCTQQTKNNQKILL